MSRQCALATTVICVAAVPTPALAHMPIAGVDGFFGGLLHPILVPSHALAIVGLALLISRQSRVAGLVAWGVFAAALLAGLLAIYVGAGDIFAGDILLALTVGIGLALALARPVANAFLWPLAAMMGCALALDSPPDVISIAQATRILAGTGLGACIALTAITAAARRLGDRGWQQLAIRIAGSWIAASALLVLSLDLAVILR